MTGHQSLPSHSLHSSSPARMPLHPMVTPSTGPGREVAQGRGCCGRHGVRKPRGTVFNLRIRSRLARSLPAPVSVPGYTMHADPAREGQAICTVTSGGKSSPSHARQNAEAMALNTEAQVKSTMATSWLERVTKFLCDLISLSVKKSYLVHLAW